MVDRCLSGATYGFLCWQTTGGGGDGGGHYVTGGLLPAVAAYLHHPVHPYLHKAEPFFLSAPGMYPFPS